MIKLILGVLEEQQQLQVWFEIRSAASNLFWTHWAFTKTKTSTPKTELLTVTICLPNKFF